MEVTIIYRLINIIGLVIINMGVFFCMAIYEKNHVLAFIFLLLGNAFGGILNKHNKRNR